MLHREYELYKFRYYNGTFKLLSGIVITLQNLFIPRILLLIIARLIAIAGFVEYLKNAFAAQAFVNLSLTLGTIWAVIYIFGRKGVFLYNDRLVIARYTITLRNWKNRITIKYSDIERVNVNYNNLFFTRHHGSQLVPLGDDGCNVELTLKNGKKYFFSIYDQELFCEQLESLIVNDIKNEP